MKIKARLVAAPPVAWPLAVGLWATVVACVAGAVLLRDDTARLRANKAVLQSLFDRLNAQASELAAHTALPPRPQLQALRQRVAAVNALTPSRGLDTTALLGWLERHLPDEVRLVSLDHKPRDGELLLVAESKNGEAITRLLRGLEQEKQFAEVLLSRQGAQSGPQSGAQEGADMRFEIRIRQRQ